jgi:phosphonate degradation associated HDIG domain protein
LNIVNEILDLFARRGAVAYHGESVSQTEHALQAAALAECDGATDQLVVAALLHDVGHLLDQQDEDLADHGIDGQHENAGSEWLSKYVDPAVTEPIRLHVAAKRYLCAADPQYLNSLSPASRLSLALQGGPMSDKQRTEFETNHFYRDALRLRRWDDTAKTPNLRVPGLEHYHERIERVVHARGTHAPGMKCI